MSIALKNWTRSVAAVALGAGLLFGGSASAATITYALEDILPTPDFFEFDTTQTFGGTGFVGMFSSSEFGNFYGHIFGLDNATARTNAQVDISGIAGETITSAVLSFHLEHADGVPSSATVIGYETGGSIGYQFMAPAPDYGIQVTTITGADNAWDITAIVQAAAAAGTNWLGLWLSGDNPGNFTYTSAEAEAGAHRDSAMVRLTVTYADPAPPTGQVPEPGSLLLIGIGLAGAGLLRRRAAR